MKYAVILFQGKQYRVEEGMSLTLDRVAEEEKKSLTLKDVLLFVDGDTVKIGAPYVDGATVKATVLSHGRGDLANRMAQRRRPRAGYSRSEGSPGLPLRLHHPGSRRW